MQSGSSSRGGAGRGLVPTEGTTGTMFLLQTGVTAPDYLLRDQDIWLCPGMAGGRSKISLGRLKYHLMLLGVWYIKSVPFATTVVMTFQVKELSPFYNPCFEANVTSIVGETPQHVDSIYKIFVAIQNQFVLKLKKRDHN